MYHQKGKKTSTVSFRINKDYDEAFFANGGIPHLAWMTEQHRNMLPRIPGGSRLGSPVARPSKIVCIGLNYADHARETNATPPAEPVIFFKSDLNRRHGLEARATYRMNLLRSSSFTTSARRWRT